MLAPTNIGNRALTTFRALTRGDKPLFVTIIPVVLKMTIDYGEFGSTSTFVGILIIADDQAVILAWEIDSYDWILGESCIVERKERTLPRPGLPGTVGRYISPA